MKIKFFIVNFLFDTYEHLNTTLLYGKDEIKFDDVFDALMNNEVRKKDQRAHRDSTLEAFTLRGRNSTRKCRGRGKSLSKSRGRSTSRRHLDKCAYCH